MKIKIFNVELDGIDKCGKDSIRPYLFYLEPGKYLCRSRGIMSQIAYATLYNRDLKFDIQDYAKNTLFVLLDINEEDWEIRCKMTNEPKTFSFYTMRQTFYNAFYALKKYGVPKNQLMIFNTSDNTPYSIMKQIQARLKLLNNEI